MLSTALILLFALLWLPLAQLTRGRRLSMDAEIQEARPTPPLRDAIPAEDWRIE